MTDDITYKPMRKLLVSYATCSHDIKQYVELAEHDVITHAHPNVKASFTEGRDLRVTFERPENG